MAVPGTHLGCWLCAMCAMDPWVGFVMALNWPEYTGWAARQADQANQGNGKEYIESAGAPFAEQVLTAEVCSQCQYQKRRASAAGQGGAMYLQWLRITAQPSFQPPADGLYMWHLARSATLRDRGAVVLPAQPGDEPEGLPVNPRAPRSEVPSLGDFLQQLGQSWAARLSAALKVAADAFTVEHRGEGRVHADKKKWSALKAELSQGPGSRPSGDNITQWQIGRPALLGKVAEDDMCRQWEKAGKWLTQACSTGILSVQPDRRTWETVADGFAVVAHEEKSRFLLSVLREEILADCVLRGRVLLDSLDTFRVAFSGQTVELLESGLHGVEAPFEDADRQDTWKGSVVWSIATEDLPLPDSDPTAGTFTMLWRRGHLRVLTSAHRSATQQLHLKLEPPFPEATRDVVVLVLGFQGRTLYGYEVLRRLQQSSLQAPGWRVLQLTPPQELVQAWHNPLQPLAAAVRDLRDSQRELPTSIRMDEEQLQVALGLCESTVPLRWLRARAGSGKTSIIKLLLHLWASTTEQVCWVLQPTRVLREATAVEHLTEQARAPVPEFHQGPARGPLHVHQSSTRGLPRAHQKQGSTRGLPGVHHGSTRCQPEVH